MPPRPPCPEAASLVVGSVLYVDGGTDAMLHPQVPVGWEITPGA